MPLRLLKVQIVIENLSFSYQNEIILDNISLKDDSNDILSIIGPNGGGKSTLLKLVLGLLKPRAGTIDAPKNLGYVPQFIPLNANFPVSVLEVVLMARLNGKIFNFYKKADYEIAMNALEAVQMSEFSTRKIQELSGGQRQRVYIARAIATQAKILVLDEPTASLDPKAAARIYELLKSLNEQKIGIFMVSHDAQMALNIANKIAFVNKNLYLHENTASNTNLFTLTKNSEHFCGVEMAELLHNSVCKCK